MAEATVPDLSWSTALAKDEQVRWLQDLRDHIATDPDTLPVPESHQPAATERLASFRRAPNSAASAYEVIDRLSNRAP